MSIDRFQPLTEQYASALQDYCLNPDRDRAVADTLGAQAAAAGLAMTDLIQSYQQGLHATLPLASAMQEGVGLAILASDFLAQSLLSFERSRQQTEAALRRSEEQFRAIFEHAAIGIVVTDSEHRIAHANSFFQNTLQYSAAELTAFGFTHVTHPEDIALEQPLISECLAGTRDTYRLEKRYIRKDGETVWSEMAGVVVRDASGQIQYSIVTMADKTAQQRALRDRQQAETALRQLNVELESRVQARTAELVQKNAELEALFRLLPDVFFRVAADGTYLECRGQSPQDFYLPPDELVGRKVQDVLPASIGQTFHETYQNVLQQNEVASMDYALTIGGIEKHFEARFVPIQPDQVMAIVRNISDRKQAEAALRRHEAEICRSRDLFAGLFEASADALFLVSPTTNCIVNCNQQAVELFDVSDRSVLIGRVGSTFHKAPFLAEDIANALTQLETIGDWSQEIEYVTQKGNIFWGYCTVKRIQVNHEPLHLVRVTDITDRKQAEAALEASEQNLRTIFNHVNHYIWVHDVDGRVLDVNQRVLEEAGQEREQLLQFSLLDYCDPSIHALLQHRWQQALNGEIIHFEMRSPHLGNGTLLDLDVTLSRIMWDGQAVVLANVQDITARKEAEGRLQHQAAAAQLMATIAQTISQSIQLQEVLDVCLEQTRQFLQCDRVLICRFDDSNTVFIEREAVSQPTFSLLGQTLFDPCFGQEWAERYRQGHIAARSDIQNERQTGAIAPCYADFLAQMQVQASLTVNILQANQLWGLLIVHHCHASRPWQLPEIDLLKQLGLQIGIASQKASLYTQLEAELAERRRAEHIIAQQVERERLLRTLSQQIRQSLRLDQILATTVTEIQRLLAADRAIVFRLNRDRSGVVIQQANLGRFPIAMEMYLTDQHFPQESYDFYLTGQARAVNRVTDDEHAPCLLEFMASLGVKSKLVAPILQTLDDGTPIIWGLLIIHACADYRQWQPAEVALLQQLATQVGIAIQQADLYAQIKTELAQKEVLLKEIHHRVKNNLQVVSALLTLQADAIQDATVLAALQDSDNRLQAMALIHETLYQSDNLGLLNFSNYLQRLGDSILLANSRYINAIHLTYQLEPVFLNLDTAIPCGLLVNELITNAIKHAFPDGRQGTICLSLRCAADRLALPDESFSTTAPGVPPVERLSQEHAPHYILSISDNGIGIPTDLNLETTKSLGLRIAFDLTQQLRGSLVLERHHGTQFHLTFADLSYRKRL